jgi:tetratricopeptide (TPR) repeat protein
VSDDGVGDYLAASDIVVMNYRSQHFEASGACSLAVGSGSVVMTSLAPAMMAFGDAVWHLTAGYPAGLAAEVILKDSRLQEVIRQQARQYAERNSWPETAKKIIDIYRQVNFSPRAEARVEKDEMKEKTVTTTISTRRASAMRILIQNRPNTFAQRGGDTVVIERLKEGLEHRGCHVVVDTEGSQSPSDFDLVHIFNFALPDLTKAFAENAKRHAVPFVVTTLYEDLPLFHNQSHAVASRLVEYWQRRQDRAWLSRESLDVHRVQPAPYFDNTWSARNAAALFCNGSAEGRALSRDYPGISNVVEVKLGHEIGPRHSAGLFEEQYKVRDFVFCVGRFESRKNQLMLLKALEDSDIPVVLASGGFSYQPEYDQAVRNFKRKGKTIILDRISAEMLSSAYAACRVHALPSWYELPGLVSLEAASYEKNVVVTRNGTAEDYFGNKAFYCQPWDEDSIYNAVMAAFYAPVVDGLAAHASSFTWDSAVDETLRAYERIIPAKIAHEVFVAPQAASPTSPASPASPAGWYDMSSDPTEFQDALERGELAAKNMEFPLAHELLGKAEAIDGQSVRVLKARGAVFLAESMIIEAQTYFDRALAVAPSDPKVLSGRGMCEMMKHAPELGLPFFLQALEIAPDHLVALHQMVDCAYKMDSFDDLQSVLTRYLSLKPDDAEMRFCFAGCLYKQKEYDEGLAQAEWVLRQKPTHRGALELKERLAKLVGSAVSGERPSVEEVQDPAAPRTESSRTAAETMPPKPAPLFGSRPLVSSEGLADALVDLSQRITDWKVNGTSQSPVAAATLPVAEVAPQVAVVAPQTPIVKEQPEVPPLANEVDVRFFDIEDAKRDRRYDEAREQLTAVLKDPTLSRQHRARAQSMQAEMLAVEGDVVGADMLYDIVLKEYPAFPRAMCGKGALAAADERWTDARAFFTEAQRGNEKYDVPYAGLALCEMAENRAETAFELFQDAVALNPENHRAILGIIQLGYPLKRFKEIEQAISAFLDLHPVNIDMMYSLAGAYYAQGNLDDAQSEVSKILLFEPTNARAVELQGMIEDRLSPRTNSGAAGMGQMGTTT